MLATPTLRHPTRQPHAHFHKSEIPAESATAFLHPRSQHAQKTRFRQNRQPKSRIPAESATIPLPPWLFVSSVFSVVKSVPISGRIGNPRADGAWSLTRPVAVAMLEWARPAGARYLDTVDAR